MENVIPSTFLPNPPAIEIRECKRAGCELRYSILASAPNRERCPRCRAITTLVEVVDQPLRVSRASGPEDRLHLEVLLDNIRSSFNVGAMFRTADGAGVRHIHLCGITPTPHQPEVQKTALGAERSVPWTYYPNGLQAAAVLKESGCRLWALEGGPRSTTIFQRERNQSGSQILLVVGNEITGVDPGVLRLCECVFAIPMQGEKQSLNVAIAFGIAIYTLRYRI